MVEYAIRLRQLARAFVDAQSVAPTAKDEAQLTESLGALFEKRSTVRVVESTTRGERTLYHWGQDLEWQLGLFAESFDLHRIGTDQDGGEVGDFGKFAERAAEILSVTLEHFGRRPHRLALVQEGLLREMPAEELAAVAPRLLRMPPSFEARSPFEWDWRCGRHGTMHIGDVDEETNLVATVKRASLRIGLRIGLKTPDAPGPGELETYDRIAVDIDVNTTHVDTRARFAQSGIREFFSKAISEHRALSDEITAVLEGRK
jgi:hypothetical protein